MDYATIHTLAYGHLLPCSPSSDEWKQPSEESLETCWFASDMAGGKKLGVGTAQVGWSP